MTAHVLSFPTDDAMFARLTEQQRLANIAEERAEVVEDARAVLRGPDRHSPQVLRDACAVLQAWGDGNDYLTADAMILTLNRKDRERAHEAAKAAAETPADVFVRHGAAFRAVCVGMGIAVLVAMAFETLVLP